MRKFTKDSGRVKIARRFSAPHQKSQPQRHQLLSVPTMLAKNYDKITLAFFFCLQIYGYKESKHRGWLLIKRQTNHPWLLLFNSPYSYQCFKFCHFTEAQNNQSLRYIYAHRNKLHIILCKKNFCDLPLYSVWQSIIGCSAIFLPNTEKGVFFCIYLLSAHKLEFFSLAFKLLPLE